MAMETASPQRVIEELNALLRRELASVSLYEEALEEIGADTPFSQRLRAMGREHARNARTLRAEIARLGGSPQGAAGVFSALGSEHQDDQDAIVRALLACEQRGLRNCEDAAGRLPSAPRALLTEVLLPARRRHVALLRSMEPGGTGHADCTFEVGEGTRTPPGTKEVAV